MQRGVICHPRARSRHQKVKRLKWDKNEVFGNIYSIIFSLSFIIFVHNPGIEAKPPSSTSQDWLLTSSFGNKVCPCLKITAEVAPIACLISWLGKFQPNCLCVQHGANNFSQTTVWTSTDIQLPLLRAPCRKLEAELSITTQPTGFRYLTGHHSVLFLFLHWVFSCDLGSIWLKQGCAG